jgi:phosphate transport system permease protein
MAPGRTELNLMAADASAAILHARSTRQDNRFRGLCLTSALIVLMILGGILLSLTVGAWPALQTFGPGFITSTEWNPAADIFGAMPAIYGTLVSSAIALLIAVPVSFGIAVFLTELAPDWLARPVSVAIELLAAVPSIIFGMWGLFVFAPIFSGTFQLWALEYLSGMPWVGTLFSGPPLGIGLLTAGLILAFMVIPYITSVMRDAFATVPGLIRESAYGVGCTTWEVIWKIVLPATRASVVGAIILGLGRALGETMAVTFVIGNAAEIHSMLFMPATTISASIADQFNEADGEMYSAALMALGLTLFGITSIVIALARWLIARERRQLGR